MNLNLLPEVEMAGDKIILLGKDRTELSAGQAHVLADILKSSANALEMAAREKQERERIAAIPPADRSAQVLVSGDPVPEDRSHTDLMANGQQKDYVVLSESERAKGFVRPVRRSYRHLKCGTTTTMSQSIAETYARDPGFYSGTFCVGCGSHFPIETFGQEGEFVWLDDGSKVGS